MSFPRRKAGGFTEDVDDLRSMVEDGFETVPPNEDTDALIAETVVRIYQEFSRYSHLTREEHALLLAALDTVKHEGVKKLTPQHRTVEYLNQIGGVRNLILSMVLEELAKTVTSVKQLQDIHKKCQLTFFHVPHEAYLMMARQRLAAG